MAFRRVAPRVAVFIASPCPSLRLQVRKELFATQRSKQQTLPVSASAWGSKLQARFQSTEHNVSRNLSGKYPSAKNEDSKSSSPEYMKVTPESIKQAIRENPFAAWTAIAMIGILVVLLIVVTIHEIILTAFVLHNYPDSVVRPLRKALYFTNVRFDPQRAMKFYKEALFAAQEAEIHPLSDEVLGIKIKIAEVFEVNMKNYNNAIMVYEHLAKECASWIQKEGDKHIEDGHRSRVLQRLVRTEVKLGELYATPYIGRDEDAEEVLTSAVDTLLRERLRRHRNGVKEGEGDFLNDDEVGGSLEVLAHTYTERNKHELATPLYLHALSLCPPKSCHSVVLMNNLAQSLAQQPPPATKIIPSLPQQAAMWAQKAVDVANSIPADQQTDECQTGCATAKANLAELAEQGGSLEEAVKLWKQAEKMAKESNFEQGVHVAGEGRRRVQRKISGQSKSE